MNLLTKTGLRPKILDILVYLIRKLYPEAKLDEGLIIYGKNYCIGFGDDLIIKEWQDPYKNSKNSKNGEPCAHCGMYKFVGVDEDIVECENCESWGYISTKSNTTTWVKR